MRIHYFTSETRRAVQAALLAGEVDGVDGYIIDLRNNPGAHGVFHIENLVWQSFVTTCYFTGLQTAGKLAGCHESGCLLPGGVFEEAIAIASLLLDANCAVAATVRTAGGFIDNSFQVHAMQCVARLQSVHVGLHS